MASVDVFSADWPGICRRIVDVQRSIFAEVRGVEARTVYEGVGKGGDRTLVIDRRCEDAVFAELETLAERGASFIAVSEERGEVSFGDGGPARVVIDPIDGSLNARRTLPSHSLSIAVASGNSMAEVEFGFVFDFGAGEEFAARRGEGATLDGERIAVAADDAEKLELLGIESAEPEWALPALEALCGRAYRLRVVGSIAITAAYVAAARLDAMLSLRPCRSVDAAAAQLIVREAGGAVAFGDLDLASAPLDLDARYPIAAAAGRRGLAIARSAQTPVAPPL
jgi:myo-inositol-1(or 4)-monophosphatase